jgi:hypothetical protein
MDIADFIRARLDEDEQAASGLVNAAKMLGAKPDFYGAGGPAAEAFWERFDPTRILADVAAKRQLLSTYAEAAKFYDRNRRAPAGELHGLRTAQLLVALPYREHPDYRPEWNPDA